MIGIENAPEPRAMKYCEPFSAIGMTLPGAGVGVEMVRLALGAVGEPHALVKIAARMTTDRRRIERAGSS